MSLFRFAFVFLSFYLYYTFFTFANQLSNALFEEEKHGRGTLPAAAEATFRNAAFELFPILRHDCTAPMRSCLAGSQRFQILNVSVASFCVSIRIGYCSTGGFLLLSQQGETTYRTTGRACGFLMTLRNTPVSPRYYKML